MFRTYRDAYRYLCRFTDYERMVKFHQPRTAWNLNRIRRLMTAVGNPQDRLKLIHIAGTKGKGSTVIFLSGLLSGRGYQVGLFTSPHLVDLKERIQINNRPISEVSFTRIMNYLLPHLKRIKPTFFETMTALGLCYFAEQEVDFAVIETGLGGRLDATNSINPLVSIITRIDFDHMDKLGYTLPQIAREKAGIIKYQIPVITIKQHAAAAKVIKEYARKQESPLFISTHGVRKSGIIVKTPWNYYNKLKLPVAGRHQAENLALALAAYNYLQADYHFATQHSIISDHRPPTTISLNKILRDIRLPGRIEVVARHPTIIIDTAHNPVSMTALAETVRREFKYQKLILVLGLARDKEVDKILRIILPQADVIIFTKTDNPRLLEPVEFIDYIKDDKLAVPFFLEPDCRKALRLARHLANRSDLILVTGSFYLAGPVRSIIMKRK